MVTKRTTNEVNAALVTESFSMSLLLRRQYIVIAFQTDNSLRYFAYLNKIDGETPDIYDLSINEVPYG